MALDGGSHVVLVSTQHSYSSNSRAKSKGMAIKFPNKRKECEAKWVQIGDIWAARRHYLFLARLCAEDALYSSMIPIVENRVDNFTALKSCFVFCQRLTLHVISRRCFRKSRWKIPIVDDSRPMQYFGLTLNPKINWIVLGHICAFLRSPCVPLQSFKIMS